MLPRQEEKHRQGRGAGREGMRIKGDSKKCESSRDSPAKCRYTTVTGKRRRKEDTGMEKEERRARN